DGVLLPDVVDLGDGGVGKAQQVADRVCVSAKALPTATDCHNLPSLPSVVVSAADIISDGVVREDVRVLPRAREALRPQPTDGLWQTPSSPVKPGPERVEMENGGGSAQPGEASRPDPAAQPVMTERAPAGLQTSEMGTRTAGAGRTVADFKGPLEGEAVSWPMNPGRRKSSRHWLGGRRRRDHRTSESKETCDSEDWNSRQTMVTTSSEVEKLESEGNRPQRPCVAILSPILEGEKPSPDVRSTAKVSEALIGLSVDVDGDSEGVLTSLQWPNLVPSEVGLALGEVSMEACCDSSPPWTASMADEAGASLLGELMVNEAGALASLASGYEECSTVVPMAAGSGLRKMMGGQLAQDVARVIADCGGQSLMVCGSSQPPVASVSSCNPPNVTDFVAAALVRGGEVIEDLQIVGSLGVARLVAAEPTGVSLLPLSCGILGMGDGGLVREKARVSSVVGEALRSQPHRWVMTASLIPGGAREWC
ncbi:hypothetical protein Dimus_037531, partial [Dionaea muscipula]